MSSSNSGCGVTAVFVLLFIVSAALNGVLLSGCVTPGKCPLCGDKRAESASEQKKCVYDAVDDLREIARKLGVELEGRDASELASAIKTQLYVEASGKGFPRELLTEQQLEETKERLPEKKAEIISEYHRFIKSLEGKRFVVVP